MLRESLRPIYNKAWQALARTPVRRFLPGYADLVAVVQGFFGDTPAPHYLTWAFTRPDSPFTRAVTRAGGWIAACELIRPGMSSYDRDRAWGAIPVLSLLGILHPGLEGTIHAPRPSDKVGPERPLRANLDEYRLPLDPGAPMLRASLPIPRDPKGLRYRFPNTEIPEERVVVMAFHTEDGPADLGFAHIVVPEPWEKHYRAYYLLPGEPLRPVQEHAYVGRHNDFRVVLKFDESTPILEESHSGIQHRIEVELYGAQAQAIG